MQSQDRRLSRESRAFFIPMRYAEQPEMYRRPEDVETVDVLFLQTCPMDENGQFFYLIN